MSLSNGVRLMLRSLHTPLPVRVPIKIDCYLFLFLLASNADLQGKGMSHTYIENVYSMRTLLDFGCESLFLSLFVTSVCRGWIIWTHTRNDTRRTDDAVDAHVASDATKERKKQKHTKP